MVIFLVMAVLALPAISVKLFAATVIPTLECFPPRFGVTIMIYSVAFTWVNERGCIVPFVMLISSMVNDPPLMASLNLNMIVLAVVSAPPLPRIIKVGPVLSSTKLPLAIILVNKLAV
ncbi:secreted protein [Bathymodiolus azoricus thioautotrophic gill symbiont]|uniref:Secreted protein n=1 Tax=Bathymodiolus azoricus thioautotrophic gill symbiont TaxID=235205 RepID=A0A1H6JT49_9GAMM|nr:secreted protein [Bathymodiolus azoricus thioautotrophic gill symbiont]